MLDVGFQRVKRATQWISCAETAGYRSHAPSTWGEKGHEGMQQPCSNRSAREQHADEAEKRTMFCA